MSRQSSNQLPTDHVHFRANCNGNFNNLANALNNFMWNVNLPQRPLAVAKLEECLMARERDANSHGGFDQTHWNVYNLIRNLKNSVKKIPTGVFARFSYYQTPNRFYIECNDGSDAIVDCNGEWMPANTYREEQCPPLPSRRRGGRTLRRKVRRSTHRTKR